MSSVKTVERLPCKLTADEILLKARQLSQFSKDVDQLEDEKKAEAARIKADIEEKESAIKALMQEVYSGEEVRPVECVERPRYDALMVDLIRSDTGAVVSSRPMHPSERQTALDMGDVMFIQGPTKGSEGAH
jgi:hypothetical protein